MKKAILCLFVFECLLFSITNAQLGLGLFKKHTRVKLAPSSNSYKLEDEDVELQDGYFSEDERWVVFSDCAKNITYKKPDSEIHLGMLDFMDACYVIGKKGDYLELVKYDPKLMKNPSKGNIDRKSADYLGWVQKSHLLLWRNALKENTSKFYLKAITCFKGEAVFTNLSRFAVKDSLLLYSASSLKDTIGKCALEELFYIFKQSDDGKQYLLGKATQVNAANRKEVMAGWVSRDFVKLWGSRSFFSFNNKSTTNDTNAAIRFMADSAASIVSPFALANTASATSNVVENIFPMRSFIEFDDSLAWMQTGLLADVLDRNENELVNVLSKKIPYQGYKKILADQQMTNIIFVADGGKENGKYLANIPTIVQNLELFFDTSHTFKNFRYGAVVYKDNLGDACKSSVLQPAPDYQAMVHFFSNAQNDVNSCNNDTIAQAMFKGISDAAKLLAPYRGQNNIIIVMGAAGNNMQNDGYTEVVSNLSYVNARLLIFQTHSIPHPSYNDFVLQAKNLVLQSAHNISELKKEKLVDLNDVLNNPSFSLVQGDSGIYSLDYPKSSMVQGYVMFPEKGQTMQPTFLGRGLDSLMHKMFADNQRVEKSLTQYFSNIGIRNTKIAKPYQFYYPKYDSSYLPVNFLKAVSFSSQPFYLHSWVKYNAAVPDSVNPVKSGILLSAEEYEQVIQTLFNLAGTKDYKEERRKIICKHLVAVIDKYFAQKNIKVEEGINKLSFAEVLEWLIGYRSANPLWQNKDISMIRHRKQMTLDEVLLFLSRCKEKAQWLQENVNNNQVRFFNNGQPYYWITGEHLP
ncbi:MAG: type VI secretion system protein TssR [Chitinophagaceae bacterium]